MEYIKDTCVQCGTKEEIVHSGTDGILLGVLNELHHICYPCANKHYLAENKNYLAEEQE